MALEALIARLQRDAATPATPAKSIGVAAKPAPILGCTRATLETPKNINAVEKAEPGHSRQAETEKRLARPYISGVSGVSRVQASNGGLFAATPTETPGVAGVAARGKLPSLVAIPPLPASDQPGRASCWLLHFSDREPLTVAFTPAASHVEALASYPDALAAGPIEPGRRQPGAPLAGDQETEIRSWLVAIGETDQATIAEVLIGCRQDEDVRRYFLDRAGEIPADDRRRCNQCGNLRGAVCIIAKPGGLVSAIVGYRPVLDILHRCAGYSMNANHMTRMT